MIARLSALWVSPRFWRYAAWLALGLAAGTALAMGNAVWSAFTWGRYALFDYGVYTNMVWNSGHGEPFRVLVDLHYLKTHLSFTLGLLGFLYHVWDHPFLLALIQWLAMVGGAIFLLDASRRHGLPLLAGAAVALFYTGYIFTQRAVLSEFHGVGLYYLLVPWLYHALSFNRRWAVVPLILTLGVREDSFIFLIPLLLHKAVSNRSKSGYLLLALAVAYGLLAITWLYPMINGITLLERRQESLGVARLFGTWHGRGLELRGRGLLLAVLPLLPFVGRRMFPLWWYPSFALASCLLSGFWRQHGLLNHYSPPVMTMLAVAMLETLIRQKARAGERLFPAAQVRALLLVALTIGTHLAIGLFPGGGDAQRHYRRPNLGGYSILRAVRHLPREGLLVTTDRMAAFTANRRDIMIWPRYKAERHGPIEVIFDAQSRLPELLDGKIMDEFEQGRWGALYVDDEFMVLQRGGPTLHNQELAWLVRHRPDSFRICETKSHGGENDFEIGTGWTRYWSGEGSRAPINLSHARKRILPAGAYAAVIRYRADPPARTVRNTWGWFTLHPADSEEVVARLDIPARSEVGFYRYEVLPFSLSEETPVEFRATGGDAPLWIDRVWLVPAEAAPEFVPPA